MCPLAVIWFIGRGLSFRLFLTFRHVFIMYLACVDSVHKYVQIHYRCSQIRYVANIIRLHRKQSAGLHVNVAGKLFTNIKIWSKCFKKEGFFAFTNEEKCDFWIFVNEIRRKSEKGSRVNEEHQEVARKRGKFQMITGLICPHHILSSFSRASVVYHILNVFRIKLQWCSAA